MKSLDTKMDLEFRLTELTESQIGKLRSATGKELPFAADVLSGRVKFWECVHDGRVVGHCIGNSSTGEILGLSVDHSYRRRGIGRKLLSLVVDLLHADGVQRIWLTVSQSDPSVPALRFYQAVGWRETRDDPATGDLILELPISSGADS